MLEIISCSRRTDIPAFYYDWLQECLKDNYAAVKNPYNNTTYVVDLSPEKVHSICLWSKSYKNVLNNPGYLSQYNLYFQFTITGYSKILESNVIDTLEAVRQMEQLANKYSPSQINWRFDPIIFSSEGEKMDVPGNPGAARLKTFEDLCRDISSFGVNRCTISFLQLYKKVEKRLNLKKISYNIPTLKQQIEFIKQMTEIADKHGVGIYTCASPLLEGIPGVNKSHCIDGLYLEQLFGKRTSKARDSGQREGCGCTRSKDIGAYDGQYCMHGCQYCYGM